MKKFSKEWWIEWFKTSSIRALWTFCQGIIGATAVESSALMNIDWIKILLTALIMALLSYAKSFVVGVPEMELSEYKVKEMK